MDQKKFPFHTYLLELYQWGVERKICYIEDVLPSRFYKNIIFLCIGNGNIELALDYLESLKQDLQDSEKEEVYQFNRAVIYFEQCKFKEVEEILKTLVWEEFTHSNIFWHINAKFWLYMSMYELDDRFVLEGHLHSLKEFIRTQKEISLNYKSFYMENVKLFERLVKVDTKRKYQTLLKSLQRKELSNIEEWVKTKTIELAKLFE